MSKIFKAKFMDKMIRCNLSHLIHENVWIQDYVINSQASASISHSLEYLAPYVFKVTISNSRIIKLEDRKVFFKYKKPRSNRWRTMS